MILCYKVWWKIGQRLEHTFIFPIVPTTSLSNKLDRNTITAKIQVKNKIAKIKLCHPNPCEAFIITWFPNNVPNIVNKLEVEISVPPDEGTRKKSCKSKEDLQKVYESVQSPEEFKVHGDLESTHLIRKEMGLIIRNNGTAGIKSSRTLFSRVDRVNTLANKSWVTWWHSPRKQDFTYSQMVSEEQKKLIDLCNRTVISSGSFRAFQSHCLYSLHNFSWIGRAYSRALIAFIDAWRNI